MDDEIVKIDWRFGNVCDWNCSYCPATLKNGSAPFFDTWEVKEACDRFIEHYESLGKTCQFSFIGGEPTIHPGFISIMRGLHNRSAESIVHTNGGSRSLEWWREAKQYVHHINLSIHLEYVDEQKIYDHYVPLLKLFEMSEATQVQVPFLPNYNKMADRVVQIIEEETPFTAQKRVLYQDAPYNTKLYDYGDLIEEKKGKPKVTNQYREGFYGWTCYAGVEQIVIDPNGNVYRGWCKMGGRLGNVLDENLVLPEEPIVCEKDLCRNNFDRQATKVQPNE